MNAISTSVVVGALAAAVLAQSPEPRLVPQAMAGGGIGPSTQTLSAVVTPIHTQEDDHEGGAYGTWAAGRDYKVSFHDGATFVPYLGADYPHNQPLRWVTESVTVGGEELATRARPEGRQASDLRFEYDHGGVIEAYDVLVDGLEQTFVIPRRPAAGGELVVRGRVETALRAPRVTGKHVDLPFVDGEGRDILVYGAATAVDAEGRALPMATSFDGERIVLALDAASVARARFPLVVDPLLQNNITIGTSASLTNPEYSDMLRDDAGTTRNVWITYTRSASSTDTDLWLLRANDDLTNVSTAFSDVTASWSNRDCQVAHCNDRVVTAFVRDFGTTRNVRWHTHHFNDTTFQTHYGSLQLITNNWRVDIGGNRGLSDSRKMMLVYQHERASTFVDGPTSEIRATYLDVPNGLPFSSNATAGLTVTVATSTGADMERPRINQVADGTATNNEWAVVWQLYTNGTSTDDWDIPFDTFDENGNSLTHQWLDPVDTHHKLGPVVAGARGKYLVAYSRASLPQVNTKTGSISGYEINTLRVDTRGTTLTLPYPRQTIAQGTTRVYTAMDVAFDSDSQSHWLVLSREYGILWADLCGFRGARTTFDNFYQGSTFNFPLSASASYDDDNGRFVLVGTSNAANSNPVFGNLWTNAGTPTWTTSGGNCSPVALSWHRSGSATAASRRIGTTGGGVLVSGLPVGAPIFLAISLAVRNQSLNVPGVAPGCSLLIDNQAPNFVGIEAYQLGSIFGTAYWPLPLIETLVPDTIFFQAFHVNAGGTEFLASERLVLPIGY